MHLVKVRRYNKPLRNDISILDIPKESVKFFFKPEESKNNLNRSDWIAIIIGLIIGTVIILLLGYFSKSLL